MKNTKILIYAVLVAVVLWLIFGSKKIVGPVDTPRPSQIIDKAPVSKIDLGNKNTGRSGDI
jgi:hypothetical protein